MKGEAKQVENSGTGSLPNPASVPASLAVSRKKVIHGLLRVKPGDRRQHTEGIGSEEQNMVGMTTHAGDDRLGDELYWIGSPGIFRVADIAVIRSPGFAIDHYILEHRAKADRMVDLWFLFRGEIDALGVAATFDVENAGRTPAVLIISDKPALRIRG